MFTSILGLLWTWTLLPGNLNFIFIDKLLRATVYYLVTMFLQQKRQWPVCVRHGTVTAPQQCNNL